MAKYSGGRQHAVYPPLGDSISAGPNSFAHENVKSPGGENRALRVGVPRNASVQTIEQRKDNTPVKTVQRTP